MFFPYRTSPVYQPLHAHLSCPQNDFVWLRCNTSMKHSGGLLQPFQWPSICWSSRGSNNHPFHWIAWYCIPLLQLSSVRKGKVNAFRSPTNPDIYAWFIWGDMLQFNLIYYAFSLFHRVIFAKKWLFITGLHPDADATAHCEVEPAEGRRQRFVSSSWGKHLISHELL